ncbi:MAG: metal-dependent hydrolase [Silvibacterium sp.]|nr:metal-dependent hydrolase [Silvibacterium sp.]
MDPLTHFLTGANLGRSGFNRKTAYATLAMTLAAEAPDLDIFWGFRGPLAGFEHHRGITHTFIAAPVIALVTTAVVWLVHKARRKPERARPGLPPPRWTLIWVFALIAALSHILLDYTNNYGVRPFFPFNPRWYQWGIVWIVDPYLLLALIGALILPWIFGLTDREIGARRPLFRGRAWSIAALIFMVLSWSVRNAEKSHALELVRNSSVVAQPIEKIDAEPYPFNPFLWHVVAQTRDYYQTAEVHTRNDNIESDTANITYKPPVTSAVAAAKQSWLGRVYLDWSKFPLVTDLGQNAPIADGPDPDPNWHTVQFDDMRFSYSALHEGTSSNPGRNPLGAAAYIGPSNQVEAIFMGGREQK